MVKKAVIEVEGCSRKIFEETMNGLEGFKESIHVETARGLERIEVRVKRVVREDKHWVVKLGLSSRGKWLWGEVFVVSIEGDESKVKMNVTRIKGVGRIHADVLGLWIIESLRDRCGGVFPAIVERF